MSGELVLLNFQRPWIKPLYGFVFLKNRTVSPAAEVFIEKVIKFEQEAGEKTQPCWINISRGLSGRTFATPRIVGHFALRLSTSVAPQQCRAI